MYNFYPFVFFSLFFISHSATATVYEFAATITNSFYEDEYFNVITSGEIERTGWRNGDRIQVSVNYDTTYNSDSDTYPFMDLTLNIGNSVIRTNECSTWSICSDTSSVNTSNHLYDTISLAFNHSESPDYCCDGYQTEGMYVRFSAPLGTLFAEGNGPFELPDELILDSFSSISIGYSTRSEFLYGDYYERISAVRVVPIPSTMYLFLTGTLGFFAFTQSKNPGRKSV
jgi:hypothetical protein